MKKRVTVGLKLQSLIPSTFELDTTTKNVVFPQNGTVATRWPITPLLSDVDLDPVINFRYFEGAAFIMVAGGVYLNKTILKYFTKINQTFADFTEANGTLFLAPDYDTATETMQAIEPSTHTIRDTTAVVDKVNTPLKPGLIENHKGVLFAARITESDGFHPTRVRWSDFAIPENFSPWGAGNFQAFEDVGEPYDEIIRILSFGDDLLIFKQKSVWVASGTQSDIVAPEYFRQISSTHRLVGPHAVVKTPLGVVMLTTGGLFMYDGNTFRPFGKEILPHLSARSKTHWSLAALGYDTTTEYLHVAVPDSDARNDDCFVRTESGWTRFVYPLYPTCFGEYGDRIAIGMSNHGLYHEVENGTHDHVQAATTSAIAGTWATDWLDLRFPNREKLMRTLEVTLAIQSAEPVTGIDLTISNFYDFETTARETNTLDLSAENCRGIYDGTRLVGIKWFLDIDGSCRRAKFVFNGSGINVLFEIMEVACSFIPRGGN